MENQQKYIVLIDGYHEYNIVQTNKKKVVYELFTSCNDIWPEHIRDTKLISIIDYKDEFEIIYHTKKKKRKKIDAYDMYELKILFNFINRSSDKSVEIYTDTKIKL